jgi:hypothetical protein
MASDVLAKMACIMHGFDGVNVKGSRSRVGGGGLIMEMSLFLAKRGATRYIPPILRFGKAVTAMMNLLVMTMTAATDRCGASCCWLFSSSC